ncbi:hypothetical protein FW778_04440 [Ginsengibacter hankyongi]|uniref:Uncharacterized protein n=1 Tax=Ginsengibacter hankyongi TaxID=2607284 RepID=A0A5J5IJQ9_9BACT|nr:hypothetical protein [Ginsengibacter hankyongi]KAA9041290.1 hypothetical protein FW778_04440 [Ginsengibacter hankyongi]
MKTITDSNENSVFEFAKRSIYSFQVLIVGVAIPFLFLFGISNANQKKIDENQAKEISNMTDLSANVIGFYIPKI